MRVRVLGPALALVLVAACRAPTASPPRPVVAARAARPAAAATGAPAFEYSARWSAGTFALEVEARLAAGAGTMLGVERGAERFVANAASSPIDVDAWAPMPRRGRLFEATACAAGPCRIRYSFALRDAADALDDIDTATVEGEIVEATPSVWLLAPARADGALRLRFRVTSPAGSTFVTGVYRAPDGSDGWELSLDDLWSSPYSAFGPMRVERIAVEGGSIELAVARGTLAVTEEETRRWVVRSAKAITSYVGAFPLPSALVLVVPARGRWVGGGRTLAGGGGTIFMRLGERARWRDLESDWVLVHEMVHLAFPSVGREHAWAEEGLATYVEPFARVRAGTLSEEDAWRGLLEGLPNGLPRSGDRGLDRTHTWGRTYWGGALFFLLADVELRKRTEHRVGLEDALRGILAAGGNNATRWPLEDAFAAGDRATGTAALGELHRAMGTAPHPVDLDALAKALGVELRAESVRFDDAAPLARVRKAIANGRRP